MALRNLTPFASGRALLGLTPLLDLHRDMNRLFEGAFRDADGQQATQQLAPVRLDVHETGSDIVVAADLPGLAKADLELRVEGDVLTIAGERNINRTENETWHIAERIWGRFERSLKLPFAPDPAQVTADFENGVLTIRVPKGAIQERGRRIEIGGSETPSLTGEASSSSAGGASESADRAIGKAARKPESVTG